MSSLPNRSASTQASTCPSSPAREQSERKALQTTQAKTPSNWHAAMDSSIDNESSLSIVADVRLMKTGQEHTGSSARPCRGAVQKHLVPLFNDERGHTSEQRAEDLSTTSYGSILHGNDTSTREEDELGTTSASNPSSIASDQLTTIFSTASHAPTEIMQPIYYMLSPKDFNAARHTCRSWMRASLDSKLLLVMLRRGGWSSATEIESLLKVSDGVKSRSSPEKARLLSCSLARQCALASNWRGNGL